MNDRQIAILLAIHNQQSITKAAQALGLTQPTLHFHMKKLEEEYQATLFLHRSGHLMLSDQAMVLLHYAKKINDLQQDAKEKIHSYSMDHNRIFYIGASMVPCKYILPAYLKQFQSQYPSIPVSISSYRTPVIMEKVCNMELDIAMVATDIPPQHPDLICLHIKDDPMVLVYSSENSELANHFSFEKITTQRFLMHDEQSSTCAYTRRWLQDMALQLSNVWYGNSHEIIKRMVLDNLGISILPYVSVEKEAKQGIVCIQKLQTKHLPRQIYCIFHKDQYELPVRQAFLKLLLPD